MAPQVVTPAPDRASAATFSVCVIFYLSDPHYREAFSPVRLRLGNDTAVPGHGELFQFSFSHAATEEDLGLLLRRIELKVEPACFLVVSDRLTGETAPGKLEPGPLTRAIRAQYRGSRHLCGLLAIDPRANGRVHEIDRVVAPAVGASGVREAVAAVATGLRLKAPPPERESRTALGVPRIQAVQSCEELRQCLALRKLVYGMMGYLPSDVMADPANVEMDSYDGRSIHFAAVRGGEVVGTVRLVLELPPGVGAGARASGISNRALLTLNDHARWCRQIARGCGPAIRRNCRTVPFMPLPILDSTEFDRRWSDVLKETSPGGELSRLVVKPEYRGVGISANLVRILIAKAVEMKRRVLLLECIPTHEEMYAKYQFRRMAGDPHSRPVDLDQYAIAMWSRLDEQSALTDSAERFLGKISMGLVTRFGPIDTPLPDE